MSGSDQDDDDAEVFRRAMQDVRPLKLTRRVESPARRPRPRARFARAERAAVLAESLLKPGPLIDAQPGDELLYRRDGVPEIVLRKLRRGSYRVEAELDLHGLTGAEAATQLAHFLQYARGSALQCLRIIHGKGLRSGQRGPVLRNTVNTLLRRADAVLAFASARPAAGGTGATLVLLRRSSSPPV
ncbi:MAG TPA: Smr/MutS family protein [Steroidobacteraceae bacterium]|nr:Smr/MutS family protein [Steroidobacteraceae bacterium]